MSRTLEEVLDEANPNKVADALRQLPAGEAFGLLPRFVRSAVVANVLTLGEGVRAAAVLSAYGTAGSVGAKLPVVGAPAAGQVAVDDNGNIIFGDAVTAAEVVYVAIEGDVVTETLPVVASVLTLVSGDYGALLLAATVDVGLVPGAKTVVARAAAPAAGEAALSGAGNTVVFEATDVVNGQATIRYVKRPAVSVGAKLATTVSF